MIVMAFDGNLFCFGLQVKDFHAVSLREFRPQKLYLLDSHQNRVDSIEKSCEPDNGRLGL